MSEENPKRCVVKSAKAIRKPPPTAIKFAEVICNKGAQSARVQASPVAKEALDELSAAVQTAAARLSDKLNLASQLSAAQKSLNIGLRDVKRKLKTYEGAVNVVAGGDASVIGDAGLESRGAKPPPASLEPVSKVLFRRGKLQREAVVTWPEAPGAGSYALEVNFDLTQPDGPYTPVGLAAVNRSRVVLAPAPGAQFLARVAAVSHDGVMSAWTAPVLVTAR